jgi:hypothetical protein
MDDCAHFCNEYKFRGEGAKKECMDACRKAGRDPRQVCVNFARPPHFAPCSTECCGAVHKEICCLQSVPVCCVFFEGSSCTNTQVDDFNCGRCGTRCDPPTACTGGRCLCSDGRPACYVESDPLAGGTFAICCSPETRCDCPIAQVCRCLCPDGWEPCPPPALGGEGGPCCPPGQACFQGVCQQSTIPGGCPSGQSPCPRPAGPCCPDGACFGSVCRPDGCPPGESPCPPPRLGLPVGPCCPTDRCIGGTCLPCSLGQIPCPLPAGPCCPIAACCPEICCQPPSPHCCSGSCTNQLTDSANCGQCGNQCPSGATCVNGDCVCFDSRLPCGGLCCAPGVPCISGACAGTMICPAGQSPCPPPNGACCVNGACIGGVCRGSTACPSGQGPCPLPNGPCCPLGACSPSGACCPAATCANGSTCPAGSRCQCLGSPPFLSCFCQSC